MPARKQARREGGLVTPTPQDPILPFVDTQDDQKYPAVPWVLFAITGLLTLFFTLLVTTTSGHSAFRLDDLPIFSLLTGFSLVTPLKQPLSNSMLNTWSYIIPDLLGSGPSSWAHLLDHTGSPIYPHCSATQQSPIDIHPSGGGSDTSTPSSPLALHFSDPSLPLASLYVPNSGVQFFPLPTTNATWVPPFLVHHPHHSHHSTAPSATSHASTATLYLRQFHFHAPGEHTIDGQRYPLEAHFVYFRPNAVSPSAVLGVLFPEAPPGDLGHPALKGIWDHLHPHPNWDADRRNEYFHVEGRLNMHDLLGSTEPVYYTYPGSLTTPPCTEGVQWYLLHSSVGVSEEQCKEFSESLGGVENFRGTMPLNGRTVQAFSQQP